LQVSGLTTAGSARKNVQVVRIARVLLAVALASAFASVAVVATGLLGPAVRAGRPRRAGGLDQ